MAFASPPPPALQARLRARVHAATLTPRWQASPALRQALQEARDALHAGVLPDVPLLLASDEEAENAYCELLETSSGRASMPPPTVPSSAEGSPVDEGWRKTVERRRRRLFVALSESDDDDEAESRCSGDEKSEVEEEEVKDGMWDFEALRMRRTIGIHADVRDDGAATPGFVDGNSSEDADEDEVESESSDEDWEPRERKNDNYSATLSWTEVLNSGRKSIPRQSSASAVGESCEATPSSGEEVDIGVAESVQVGRGTAVKKSMKPSSAVIDLCNSDDEDIASLVAGVQKVSIRDKAPDWLTSLTRSELASTRDVVAQRLMTYLDEAVLSSRLSNHVCVAWNKRLLTTAGYTTLVQKGSGVRTASIDLSVKVLDEPGRLYMTLAHEMCHAAAWIVDGVRRPAHGKVFKKWAMTFKEWDMELNITRCHSFAIRCKYNYRCQRCSHVWGRHSKSIDTTKVRCSCKGLIVLQPVEKDFGQ